jgi:hypothetical protein
MKSASLFLRIWCSHGMAVTVSMLVLLSSASCFRDPDTNKVLCHGIESKCPDGYVCKMVGETGRCCKPDDFNCPISSLDGAARDTLADVSHPSWPEAGQSVDGQEIDGAATDSAPVDSVMGTDFGPGDATPDASTNDTPLLSPDGEVDVPPDGRNDTMLPAEDGRPEGGTSLKGPGELCSIGAECAGGQCADGVCCDKACVGCSACTKALTSKSDGTCASVSNGIDPHGTCGTSCSGSTLTTLVCNGTGTCTTATSQACPGGVLCADSSVCKSTSCSSDSQCAGGYRCNGTSCVPKKTLGSSCGAGDECSSGNCVSSICCSSSSCPACQTCSGTGGTCAMAANSNGQSCGTNMYCSSGVCGACTPNQACSTGNACENGATSCSTGTSVCVKDGNQDTGTPCGAKQSCSGTTLTTADQCDGNGKCILGTSSSCPYGCTNNDCTTLAPVGAPCTTSSQCASRACAGVGTGTCQATCGDAVGATCCVDKGGCTAADSSCSSGKCVSTCGDLGRQCCADGSCHSGSVCNTSTNLCATCGGAGYRCCAGNTCSSGTICNPSANLCILCGDVGQQCCPGSICTVGVCSGNACVNG